VLRLSRIGSFIRRLEDAFTRGKFAPRKPTSKWFDSDRKRWAELKAAGVLTSAGLLAPSTAKSLCVAADNPRPHGIYRERLKANPKAGVSSSNWAASYRRRFVGWIPLAKRPETRESAFAIPRIISARKKAGIEVKVRVRSLHAIRRQQFLPSNGRREI